MTKDIIVTVGAYVVTVASFAAWICVRKPDRIPCTRKTIFALCLRSIPLFVLFFFICRSFDVPALFGLIVLLVLAFLGLTPHGWASLPGLALFYMVQQWILGWPDRALLVNQVTLESNQGQAGPADPLIGRTARVVSPLRPSGKVVVDGREVDASCEFGFLDAGAEARIVGKRSFIFLVQPMN